MPSAYPRQIVVGNRSLLHLSVEILDQVAETHDRPRPYQSCSLERKPLVDGCRG